MLIDFALALLALLPLAATQPPSVETVGVNAAAPEFGILEEPSAAQRSAA